MSGNMDMENCTRWTYKYNLLETALLKFIMHFALGAIRVFWLSNDLEYLVYINLKLTVDQVFTWKVADWSYFAVNYRIVRYEFLLRDHMLTAVSHISWTRCALPLISLQASVSSGEQEKAGWITHSTEIINNYHRQDKIGILSYILRLSIGRGGCGCSTD